MKASETTHDALADIAQKGIAKDLTGSLVPQTPPELADIQLPDPGDGDGMAFTPRPQQTAETLQAELVVARESMRPFMQDLTPSFAVKRPQLTLSEADWRLEPETAWTHLPLPHYGGPIGKARAWYRMEFSLTAEHFALGAVWLCFGGVDYKAAVFLNGHLVGTHEGFFSPFEFEITADAKLGENELLVRVDNDAICQGNNAWDDPSGGDKIYGATGLGWDEPGTGWHHCPPGMGIHRPVRIEGRPKIHVIDVFARPLPDEHAVEIRAEIFNSGRLEESFELEIEIHGQNFTIEPIHVTCTDLPPAGSGFNLFRIRVPLPDARIWNPDTPWLYQARVILNPNGAVDGLARQFGMRTFLLDESPGADGRRGRFFLNGEPIRLRGANTMGNEQQCVLKGDFDQLRDDILLAKLANMNFLRLTQRPVETEVYEMCDRLGLLIQCDLPLFAFLRRNQFSETVRQAAEMERLVRGHACVILATFINEPFPALWGDKSHRHLNRTELENFFIAATHAMHVENPDRQIKPIDGDYEPPGPGLPDNHCYAGWYNGHGIDLGKLHKGHWVDVKPGWNYGCGEFGSEGLDFEEIMRAHYPPAWLPAGPEEEATWTPKQIHKAQTGDLHYLWMEPADSMADWIERSHEHQTWITRLMTESFRRDNRMITFAIHLFIDAWPAGWMKTIMDFHRQPKPAYFAYRDALAPLAVSCRIDRTKGCSGEVLHAEAWVCNDTNEDMAGIELSYQIELGGTVIRSSRTPAVIRADEAVFQGHIPIELPDVTEREMLQIRIGLVSKSGETLHDTLQQIEVFPVFSQDSEHINPHFTGGEKASLLASEITLDAKAADQLWIVEDPAALENSKLLEAVINGATALVIELPPGEYQIAGSKITIEEAGMGLRHFVSRAMEHPLAALFRKEDFKFWYDPTLDRPAPLMNNLFFADDSWQPILRTGQGGWGRGWEPALAAAEKPYGKGRFIICQVTLAGRLLNPTARIFANALVAPRSIALPQDSREI